MDTNCAAYIAYIEKQQRIFLSFGMTLMDSTPALLSAASPAELSIAILSQTLSLYFTQDF